MLLSTLATMPLSAQEAAASVPQNSEGAGNPYEPRVRRVFVSSGRADAPWDAYMKAWMHQVLSVAEERGALGDQGRTPRSRAEFSQATDQDDAPLEGKVIVDTAIRSDGSLDDVNVLQSSGDSRVDAAAVDIVKRAAPFAALPHSGSPPRQRDVLHITRTFEFRAPDT